MKKTFGKILIVCFLTAVYLTPLQIEAQPHLSESLLLHLNLLLKNIPSDINLQVRIHATDRVSDAYFASPVDPDEGNYLQWNQDLQLIVDSNLPLQLIFNTNSTNGAPLPDEYSVVWQYNLNGQGFSTMTSNTVVIPADSSGDMNLFVQGTVVSE